MRLQNQLDRQVLLAFLQGATFAGPGPSALLSGETLYFGLLPVARRFRLGQPPTSEQILWFDWSLPMVVSWLKEAAVHLQGPGVSLVAGYRPPADLPEALAWRALHQKALETTMELRRLGWRPLVALPEYSPSQAGRRWRHGKLTGRRHDPTAPPLRAVELPRRAGLFEQHLTRYRPGTAARPVPSLGPALWFSGEGASLVAAAVTLAKAQQLPVRTAIGLLLAGRDLAVS